MAFPVSIQSTLYTGEQSVPQVLKNFEDTLRFVLNNTSTTQAIWDMTGFNSFSLQIDNGGLTPSATITILGSNDLVQWSQFPIFIGEGGFPITSSVLRASNVGPLAICGNRTTRYVKISMPDTIYPHRINVIRSTAIITPVKADFTSNPDVAAQYISPSGGITSSPITLFSGPSPALKVGLASIEATNVGTAFVEASILDGAAGTAIWRGYIPASGRISQKFDVTPKGSFGNLLQLTLTSTAPLQVSFAAFGAYLNG